MKNSARIVLLVGGDMAMLVASFFIMLTIAFPGQITKGPLGSHLFPFIIIGVLWLLIFFIFNLYATQLIKPTIPHLRQIAIAFLVAMTVSFVFFYVFPLFEITPKTNLVIFGATFIVLFMLWRRVFYSIFAGFFKKSLAIITHDTGKTYVDELVDYITTYPQSGFFLTGIYDSAENFIAKRDSEYVDTLIVSKGGWNTADEFRSLYNRSHSILELSYAYEDILGKIPVASIDDSWFLHNINRVDKGFHTFVARLIGVTTATILLIITAPLVLIVACVIKIDDGGSIFFSQTKVGKNGKLFRLYKIRSMIPNADSNGAQWTEKNDPRITRVGKIIRRLHVDEIPQLWNVIKGDMMLVGPRPELPSFVKQLEAEIPHYNLRHIITPGFTGWAQIKFRNARGIEESKEKFEYDLYYIKNRNVFMDFGILLRTIIIIFTHN